MDQIVAAPARLAPHVQVEQDDWLNLPPMRWTRLAERFDQFLPLQAVRVAQDLL